jgi:hypothetical protein
MHELPQSGLVDYHDIVKIPKTDTEPTIFDGLGNFLDKRILFLERCPIDISKLPPGMAINQQISYLFSLPIPGIEKDSNFSRCFGIELLKIADGLITPQRLPSSWEGKHLPLQFRDHSNELHNELNYLDDELEQYLLQTNGLGISQVILPKHVNNTIVEEIMILGPTQKPCESFFTREDDFEIKEDFIRQAKGNFNDLLTLLAGNISWENCSNDPSKINSTSK